MDARPVLVWFRHALRVSDHPALKAAVDSGAPVVPLYVLDDFSPGAWRLGRARRWWLNRSLEALGEALRARGSYLCLRRGAAGAVLVELARKLDASAVYFTRGYEPWARQAEETLRRDLAHQGVSLERHGGALLYEPEDVRQSSGAPFSIFTPFLRAASKRSPRHPCPAPSRIRALEPMPPSDALADWQLEPRDGGSSAALREAWVPGERAAGERLDHFVEQGGLADYHLLRDRPDLDGTSRLSPYLAAGEISPSQCWYAAQARGEATVHGRDAWLRELAWREFSWHLLYHFPKLPDAPMRAEFERFPWESDETLLERWKTGRTGYPLVDAGMRTLRHTGWMNNRVRMVAASFLVKHLLIPWQMGEAWFWERLVDGDLASNAVNWQWIAGSGVDAAPYFRIFNPTKQAAQFDPEGRYVATWVPELAGLPSGLIHTPWLAPQATLAEAGLTLGGTYPAPIIDHRAARARALEAFAAIMSARRS